MITRTYNQSIQPRAFIIAWNLLLDGFATKEKDAEGEIIGIWKLPSHVIKRRKIMFDDCSITLRLLSNHPEYITCQVGLIHATKKNDATTTHWRTVMLSLEDISTPVIMLSKIIIAASSMVGQGKLQPEVCVSIAGLIEKTLDYQLIT